MSKRHPLSVRLYFEPHLTELVRLVGYQALPVPKVKERMGPMVQRYGKDKINAAIKELFEIDGSQEPPLARLNEAARRAAWQLLGPEEAAQPVE